MTTPTQQVTPLVTAVGVGVPYAHTLPRHSSMSSKKALNA